MALKSKLVLRNKRHSSIMDQRYSTECIRIIPASSSEVSDRTYRELISFGPWVKSRVIIQKVADNHPKSDQMKTQIQKETVPEASTAVNGM